MLKNLLLATTLMMTALAAEDRVFEMRTYYTHEGKLPDLLARFKNHTVKLFEKHGMTNIGYWVPLDEPKSKNTLVYILAYPSRDAAKKAWDAFRVDPEWIKARDTTRPFFTLLFYDAPHAYNFPPDWKLEFQPSMGCEDFSFLLQGVRDGAYAWIGAGDVGPGEGLHGDRFVFNDAIIPVGIRFFLSIVQRALPRGRQQGDVAR